MRRPKYGWGDGALRAGAVLELILGVVQMWPYPGTDRAFAQIALGLAALAISAVERLRQDLRADRAAALRGDTP